MNLQLAPSKTQLVTCNKTGDQYFRVNAVYVDICWSDSVFF